MILHPLLRFQLATAVRLSLRAAAPLLGLAVIAIGLSREPEEEIRNLSLAVATRRGGAGALLVLGITAAALSAWAIPRLTYGLGGWFRHMPVSGSVVRRCLVASLAASQTAALAAWMLLWIVARTAGAPAEWIRLACVPVIAVGAAMMVLPARRRWLTASAGAGALLACMPETWPWLAAGAGALVAGDLVAGRVCEPEAPPEPLRARFLSRSKLLRGRPDAMLPALISLRAAGGGLLRAYAAGFVPLIAAWLFIANNRLDPRIATGAARLGGGCAMTLFLGQTVAMLAARRPAWAWSRALPWSSASRILQDAGLLALLSLPFVALAAAMDGAVLLPLAVSLPLFVLLAADAIRGAGETSVGSMGPFLALSSIVAAWLGISGWTSLAAAAATPWALRTASRREARLKPSGFDARRHLPLGDPQSTSGR